MRSFRVPDFPKDWMLARISIMAFWNLGALFFAWLLFGPERPLVLGSLAASLFLFFPTESFFAYLLGIPFVDLMKQPNAVKHSRLSRFLFGTAFFAFVYSVQTLIEHPVIDLRHAISFFTSIPLILTLAAAVGVLFAFIPVTKDEEQADT